MATLFQKFEDIRAKIYSNEDLEYFGVLTPTEKACASFKLLYDFLPKKLTAFGLCPVPGGGLQLEYLRQGHYVEIEIRPDGQVMWFMINPNGTEEEGLAQEAKRTLLTLQKIVANIL